MIERTAMGPTAWRVVQAAASAAVLAVAGCGDSASTAGGSAGAGGASAGSAATAGGGMLVSAGGAVSGGSAGSSSPVGGAAGSAGGAFAAGGDAGGFGLAGGAGSAGMAALGGTGGTGGCGGLAGMLGGSGGAGGDAAKIVLFDGQDLSLWKSRNAGGGPAPWTVANGAFTVVPNSGDIETKQAFGDIQLHVEFWIPTTPTTNAEQDRGNSGVYLQGRYEVQVLDSYQHPLDGANDCGAIYELKNADVNASLPPENWQTYEITFRAPRWSGQTKTESAKISVIWNGQQAQKDISVPAPTKLGDPEVPGDAPLRLQDHGHSVRYRNIWLQKL